MITAEMEPLDINSTARDVEDYLERFEIWCLTKEDLSDEKKLANLLHFLGKPAFALLKNLAFPVAPMTLTLDKVKNILLQHYKPINFVAAERAKFNTLMRSDDQTVRDFILELQTQAAKCDYGEFLQDQLRDRLIAGINLPALQQRLLVETNQSFQNIRNICEQFQDVKSVTQVSENVLFNSINRSKLMSSRTLPAFKQHQTNRGTPIANSRSSSGNAELLGRKVLGNCSSCGQRHLRSSCPYRRSKCYACGKVGHIKSVCRATEDCRFAVQDPDSTESLTESVSTLTLSVLPANSEHISIPLVSALDRTHSFIIDTGSVHSIIPKNGLSKFFPNAQILSTDVTIRGITGDVLPIVGSSIVPIKMPNSKTVECSFLVSNRGPSVLGLQALRMLKIDISLLTTPTESSDIKSLILKCSELTGGMHIPAIKLESSGDPIFLKRRIIPFGLREPVRLSLQSMCDKGVLTQVESSKWATPIVTPLKADGKTPRICGDYRMTLNKTLLQHTCTTEEPEDVLYRLSGSKVFSKIDLKDAYLQIPLDRESSELTVINTPFGLYRYNFLPFGLSVSPAIFQQCLNKITEGLEGVESYQDDVIVHGKDQESHKCRLLALLKRFLSFNVSINPAKCAFAVTEFTCLGYIINASGFSPDKNRLAPLVDSSSPTNLHELRSLLGALQYYSRFIPNFAQRASTLFNLMSSDLFVWSSEHETTLRSLLAILKSDLVLKPFSPSDHSTVITDASPTGIGAVLEQNDRPVICISRRLSKAEQGYSQTQREALAVYWAVKRLHKYLFGAKFTIVTDHEALKFIYSPDQSLAKSSAAMVQRWNISLSSYTYNIVHRSAKHIPHVDLLSRSAPSVCVSEETDCLLIQPLPVKREDLIRETRKYFASILSALRRGWTLIERRKFPVFYNRRESLSVTPDGLLCMNDRIVIPPAVRSVILSDLHSGHLGVDKMKSLARLTCWWPELDADIIHFAKNCKNCLHKIHSKPSKWIPWPVCCEAWQRIHADYCGPFLGKYYALVIIDSFSRWPEVFLTTNPTAEFTQIALRKTFSREGVPFAFVTDNGTHFTAKILEDWLTGLGCRHLFTAPRHPQSNGLAENFVKTFKSAIQSSSPQSFHELDCITDNFLMQYRNAVHSTSGKSPAQLFKSRTLRTSFECVSSANVHYFKGNDLRPATGIVVSRVGNRMVKILDLDDLSTHKRHVDQVQFNTEGGSDIIPAVVPSTNSSDLDVRDMPTEEVTNDENTLRRSERIRSMPVRNYKHPHVNSSCGGCGIHD